jgi:hypothetical protein
MIKKFLIAGAALAAIAAYTITTQPVEAEAVLSPRAKAAA